MSRTLSTHNSTHDVAALYSDERVKITPSWLSIEQTRYAIRTVVRLDNQESRPRVGIAYVFFFVAIVLIAYSLYQFKKPELPALIPWIMLLASVVVWIYSGWVAFSSKTRYRVLVTLFDGHEIVIKTTSKPVATAMLTALTQAMDWHRNEDIVIEAERESHVRRRLASASGLDDESLSDAEQSDKQRNHLNKLMPLVAAMLKGRQ